VFQLARRLEDGDVSSRSLPVVDARRGGADVLLPTSGADDVEATLRGDVPDLHPGAAETPQQGPQISPC
jgi:hypothetical protein